MLVYTRLENWVIGVKIFRKIRPERAKEKRRNTAEAHPDYSVQTPSSVRFTRWTASTEHTGPMLMTRIIREREREFEIEVNFDISEIDLNSVC